MQTVARGPQDGVKLVELFGGVRKKKVFLYFSSGNALLMTVQLNESTAKQVRARFRQSSLHLQYVHIL